MFRDAHMPALSPMTPEAKRGRLLLLIAIAVTLFGDGLVILLKMSRVGLVASGGSVIRWFITAALFYAVWRGHRWVRWLMVGLLGLGLLLTVPAMLRSLHPLLIAVVFQISITVALLAIPPSVSAFIDYQRERYNENT